MAATPYNVAEAFMKNNYARRGNYYSTGTDIYSYNLKLATWTDKGPVWVVDPTEARKISVTTARHINALLYVLPYS